MRLMCINISGWRKKVKIFWGAISFNVDVPGPRYGEFCTGIEDKDTPPGDCYTIEEYFPDKYSYLKSEFIPCQATKEDIKKEKEEEFRLIASGIAQGILEVFKYYYAKRR